MRLVSSKQLIIKSYKTVYPQIPETNLSTWMRGQDKERCVFVPLRKMRCPSSISHLPGGVRVIPTHIPNLQETVRRGRTEDIGIKCAPVDTQYRPSVSSEELFLSPFILILPPERNLGLALLCQNTVSGKNVPKLRLRISGSHPVNPLRSWPLSPTSVSAWFPTVPPNPANKHHGDCRELVERLLLLTLTEYSVCLLVY